jgi:hypothetical protein
MQRQTFGGLRYAVGLLPLMLLTAGPMVAAESPAAQRRTAGVCFQGPPGRDGGKELAPRSTAGRGPGGGARLRGRPLAERLRPRGQSLGEVR